MTSITVIIVRYNENLDWIYQLRDHYNIIIYNKGNTLDQNFKQNVTVINVENKGRESEGYLRFIIENYEKINDEEYYLFLQANPFDHSKNIIEKIDWLYHSEANKSFIHLGDLICIDFDNYKKYINKNAYNIIINIIMKLDNTYTNNNMLLCNIILDKYTKFKIIRENFIHRSEYRKNVYNNNINKAIEIYNWSEGALFGLKGKSILNNKKEYYVTLKQNLLECHVEDLGYLYERYWCLFFMG